MTAVYSHAVVHMWGFQRFIPTEDNDLYIWTGDHDLDWDGATWVGLGRDQGSLLEVGTIHSQQGLPDNRTTIRLSVANSAMAMFMSHDFSGIDVDLGNIGSTDNGRSWFWLPQRDRGRLSEVSVQDGIASAVVETYMGDIDRGIVRFWDDASQRDRSPRDTGFSRQGQLAERLEFDGWPG